MCVPDGPLEFSAMYALEPDVDEALSPTLIFKLCRGKRDRIPSTSFENDVVLVSSLSIYPPRIFWKIGADDRRVERLSMYTRECASESWIVADSSCIAIEYFDNVEQYKAIFEMAPPAAESVQCTPLPTLATR